MAEIHVRTLGRQVIAEFYSCEKGVLEDPDRLRRHLLEAATRIRATVMAEAVHRFENGGVSATLVIAESHLSIHTWPDRSYAAVDLFTCGGLDPRPAFALLGRALGAKTGRMQEIVRGLPEEIDDGTVFPEDVLVLARSSDLVSFPADADEIDFDGEWFTATVRGSSASARRRRSAAS